MEAKMALVNILKTYKFEKGPDTQVRHHIKCNKLYVIKIDSFEVKASCYSKSKRWSILKYC